MKARGEGATLNGFLDKGSHFKGELSFEETFRIDGKFEGTIPAGGELILGDSAEVTADIRVERISINGTLKGTVHASEKIEIHPRARVTAEAVVCVVREDPRRRVARKHQGTEPLHRALVGLRIEVVDAKAGAGGPICEPEERLGLAGA